MTTAEGILSKYDEEVSTLGISTAGVSVKGAEANNRVPRWSC